MFMQIMIVSRRLLQQNGASKQARLYTYGVLAEFKRIIGDFVLPFDPPESPTSVVAGTTFERALIDALDAMTASDGDAT